MQQQGVADDIGHVQHQRDLGIDHRVRRADHQDHIRQRDYIGQRRQVFGPDQIADVFRGIIAIEHAFDHLDLCHRRVFVAAETVDGDERQKQRGQFEFEKGNGGCGAGHVIPQAEIADLLQELRPIVVFGQVDRNADQKQPADKFDDRGGFLGLTLQGGGEGAGHYAVQPCEKDSAGAGGATGILAEIDRAGHPDYPQG